MNAWKVVAKKWRKEAKRQAKRNELVFADSEILEEFGETQLERYAQTSPPEMFQQLLRLEAMLEKPETERTADS